MVAQIGALTRAAGAAAWQVADLIRAELDSGSSRDVVVFLADRLALHIASQHHGEADDCHPCTTAIWKEQMQAMTRKTV